MPLRPDREVEPPLLRVTDVAGEVFRFKVEIRVYEADPFAFGFQRTELHGVALAQVPVVVEDAKRPLRRARDELRLGRVDRTVRNDDDLEVDAELLRNLIPDDLEVRDDRRGLVEHRHDDREQGPRRLPIRTTR